MMRTSPLQDDALHPKVRDLWPREETNVDAKIASENPIFQAIIYLQILIPFSLISKLCTSLRFQFAFTTAKKLLTVVMMIFALATS